MVVPPVRADRPRRYVGRVALIGWGDESGSDARRDPDTYILSAVIAEEARTEDVRAAMLGLLLRGQRKLHWRGESTKRREKIVQVIAELPVDGLVVVRNCASTENLERRRRKCMEHLLWEAPFEYLILESRGAADDRRDMAMLQSLRARKAIPAEIRADHAPGPTDPALWAADAVCGAISQDRIGEPRYLATLQEKIDVRVISI